MNILKNKWIIIIITLLVLAGLSFFFLNKKESKEGAVPSGEQFQMTQEEEPTEVSENKNAVNVETETAEKGSLNKYLVVTGETNAYQKSEVVPRIQEEVEKINVKIGDKVKTNEVLIELNTTEKEIAVKQAEATLESANANLDDVLAGSREEEIKQLEASLKKAESALGVAKNNYQRQQELYEKDFISSQSLESAKNDLVSAESDYQSTLESLNLAVKGATKEEIASARAEVKNAEASLESAELGLNRTKIKAPISGVISAIDIDNGEITASSSVITIAQMDKLKIKIYLSQSNVNKVSSGEKVKLYIAAVDKEITGQIESISPVADEDKKSFPVEIVVDNRDRSIKAGMYAEVNLVVEKAKDQLVLSRSALIEEAGNNYIYIIEDGKAKKIEVEIIVKNNDKIAIENAIEPGTEVIVTGNDNLSDGARVNVLNRGDK
jgi:multidrug efflux pump subunit AcrA (membrane-fusion protein)